MKNLIIAFLMLFASAAYSQADTIFVLASEFGAVTVLTDSTYQVAIEHPADQLGQGFLPTKIRVGYLLFDSYGRRYRVKTIVSANFGQSVLDVVELQDNNIGPLGVGIVHRKPDDSDCVPEIPGGNTGLAPATLARIHNHNVANGCNGGSGNQTAAQVDIDTILTLPSATNVQNALEEAGANINALAGSIPTLTSELTNDVPFLVTETPQTLSISSGSITLSDGGGTVGLISTDVGNTIAAGADGKLYSAAGAEESTTVSDTPTIDLTLTGSDVTGEVVAGSIGPTQLASTGITPATYTNANVTFDADGRATAASNGTGGGVATVVAGTGISVNATDPANPVVTNTAPDQTVAITGAGSVAVTGTYPNFVATGSGVTGTGTVNTIPKFTGTSTLGNSSMSDSGTKITSTVPLVTNSPGGGGVYRQTCYSTSGAQLGGVGYLIIETGIPTVPTTYLHLDFGYYFYGTSFAGNYPGNIQVSMLCADNLIYNANANSTGKMRFGQGIKVGRKTSDNTVVIILGDGVSAINFNHVWLKSIQCSNGSVGYCGENFVYSVGTDLTAYTALNDMVAPNTSAIAPMLLSNNVGGSGVNNLIVLSNPQGGTKDRAGISFRSRTGGLADPTVDQGYVIEGVNTVAPTAKSGISIRTNSANSYGDGSTETAFFGRNGFVSIGAYAGDVPPAYQLDVQGTSAAIRLNPHNTTLTGTEGLLFANSVTKGLKGHDGTSFYRIPKFTDAAPANGQIPVFNSTSGMYTATTPTYLTAEVDGSTTNEGALTVGAGGANTSTIVSNTSGSTPVTIAGGTNVTVTEAGSTITIAASGGTMSSFNAAADAGTPANVTNATTLTHAGGIGLSTSVSGSTVTTNLAQSEVTVKGTAESDQYFLIYDATDGVSWNLDFDVLKAAIVAGGNGVYGGSGTVPDFTTAADANGASVSWNDGNLNLGGDVFIGDVTTGTPNRLLGVTATNLVVEYTRKDTLVIPIYCHGWNDAIATGADYRGWRVPSHLNNARIIKIQYSADDINGGTVLLQTTNGGTNFGSATIPVGGDVESGTISQTITTGQRIRPDVNSITGSPNGLMMNLIIEK